MKGIIYMDGAIAPSQEVISMKKVPVGKTFYLLSDWQRDIEKGDTVLFCQTYSKRLRTTNGSIALTADAKESPFNYPRVIVLPKG